MSSIGKFLISHNFFKWICSSQHVVIPQDKPEVIAPGIWGIVPENKKPNEIKDYYKEAVKFGAGLNAQSEKLFSHFIYKNVVLT